MDTIEKMKAASLAREKHELRMHSIHDEIDKREFRKHIAILAICYGIIGISIGFIFGNAVRAVVVVKQAPAQ